MLSNHRKKSQIYMVVHDSFDGYFIEHFPCSLNCRREYTTASFCVPNWGKTIFKVTFIFKDLNKNKNKNMNKNKN